MDDECHSITEAGRQLRSPDTTAYNAAAARIYEEFDAELLRLIRRMSPARMRRKLDAEDVVQSVLRSFFRGGAEFANRRAMWGFLRKAAINKLVNKVKYYEQERRDCRREVEVDANQGLSATCQSQDSPQTLEAGRKLVPCSRVRRASDRTLSQALEQGSDDSFLDNDLVAIMAQGAQQEHADFIHDFLGMLKCRDQGKEDGLLPVVQLCAEGLSFSDVANRLGLTTRTIQRRVSLIEKLVLESKVARIRQADARTFFRTVFRIDTATDILQRLGFDGKKHRLAQYGPSSRVFAAEDKIYDQIGEDDELEIRPI